MGLRMSKISYKMSEVEKRLGYTYDTEESGVDLNTQESIAPSTSFASECDKIVSLSSEAESTSTREVSKSQYQSNSSLSSGNGETSCVHLSWPKSTAEKFSKKRKVKGAAAESNAPIANLNPAKVSVKKPKKNYLKVIGGSSKKKESSRSIEEDASSLPNPSCSIPSRPASCVCTGYRRNSEPQDPHQVVPGSSSMELVPAGHRLSTQHVLGVFNPDDYPIEDEDEKMRRQRAREMAEGVELCEKFGILSFSKGENSQLPAHSQVDYIHCLVPDLKEITSCSFYWGKIDRYVAEKLLEEKPEGTFLLRDSAQEEYLFSVSFRRYGRSLHARIEQWNHSFSFDAHDPSVFSAPTVTGLIEHYKDPNYCMFFEPMLTIRLYRNFTFSLQHLARSIICNQVTYDSISSLLLPKQLKSYCREYHYKQRVRVRNFPD